MSGDEGVLTTYLKDLLADGNFRERSELELTDLSDEQLIDYIRAARAAGRGDAVTLALRILVFGYLENIERRVALKVPDRDVSEVAARAMESALKAAFDEESVGQFRSWLNTITSRRIADYHRDREDDPASSRFPMSTRETTKSGARSPGASTRACASTPSRRSRPPTAS